MYETDEGGIEQCSAIKPNVFVCDCRMRSSGSRLWAVVSSGLAHGGSMAACRSPGRSVNHELSQIRSVRGASQKQQCNSDGPLRTSKSGSSKSEAIIKSHLNRFLTYSSTFFLSLSPLCVTWPLAETISIPCTSYLPAYHTGSKPPSAQPLPQAMLRARQRVLMPACPGSSPGVPPGWACLKGQAT